MSATFDQAVIQSFSRNTRGVDYALGDIHGCYRHLKKRLTKIGFNPDCDRLFPCGDLVDRGPESEWVLDFLGAPYFHPTLGNHELYIMKLYRGRVPSQEELKKCYEFKKSGFEWWGETSKFFRQEFIKRIQKIAPVNEVDTELGKVGMIHADVPVGMHWSSIPELLKLDIEDTQRRALFSSRTRDESGDTTPVPGIERVFVGHNVVRKVRVLGNIVNLDTGAYKGRGHRWPGQGGLSIVRIDTPWDVLHTAIEQSKPGKGLLLG